jgi:hypothetical protein
VHCGWRPTEQLNFCVCRQAHAERRYRARVGGGSGSSSKDLQLHLLTEAVQALWHPARISEEEETRQLKSVVAMLEGIKPEGEIEGMLAAQMVAIHYHSRDHGPQSSVSLAHVPPASRAVPRCPGEASMASQSLMTSSSVKTRVLASSEKDSIPIVGSSRR